MERERRLEAAQNAADRIQKENRTAVISLICIIAVGIVVAGALLKLGWNLL